MKFLRQIQCCFPYVETHGGRSKRAEMTVLENIRDELKVLESLDFFLKKDSYMGFCFFMEQAETKLETI